MVSGFENEVDRRAFLRAGLGSSFALLTTALSRRAAGATPPVEGLGPLSTHPGGLLSLPRGFRYVVVQRAGDPLSDGCQMPPQPDGMACFQSASGQLVLLRNHELGDGDILADWGGGVMPYPGGRPPSPRYRDGLYGGVSRVVLDPSRLATDLAGPPGKPSGAVVRSHMVLAGTDRNCAGGVVQGGWVSCEESSTDGHGYAFLTRPEDQTLVPPRRIESWGRFQREAVAHDQAAGVVYMTEDHADAALYRFVPDAPNAPMGKGRVEALAIEGVPHTHPYTHEQGSTPVAPHWAPKQSWTARWVRIPDPLASKVPCREQAARLGATRFCRTEGVAVDRRGVWFVASTAGRSHGGQIFRYQARGPDQGLLVLEHEVGDRKVLSSPDNVVMSPWGDLLMAEDNYEPGGVVTHQHLRCMSATGGIYDFARNNEDQVVKGVRGSEFTGLCFSPDGRFLFANLQTPTQVTVAITGPWPRA